MSNRTEEKNYFEDLKNLKPLPLDRIQRTEVRGRLTESRTEKNIINIVPKQLKEVGTMERLNTSKTLWGFGIALFIYVLESILSAANIASPDNLLLKATVEVIIAVAGFFGVYGIRDALRKINSNL